MAKRRPPIDFAAKMAQEAAPAAAVIVPPPSPPAQYAPPPAATDRSYVPPTRRGRKMLGGYYSDEVHEQLERLILDHRRNPDAPKTKEAALDMALDLLFTQYGLPQIAKHGKPGRRGRS